MTDDGMARAFKEALLEATGCGLLNLIKVTINTARFAYIDKQNRRVSVMIVIKSHEALFSPTVLNRCIRLCQIL